MSDIVEVVSIVVMIVILGIASWPKSKQPGERDGPV